MKAESSLKPSWRWILLISLVLVGLGMRIFRLSHWGFAGDELFTLRDSLRDDVLSLRAKPLLFILNHYLVAPFLELDEFGLRLLPMAFGVAAIAAVFFLASRILGPRSGLFSALLVTFSPWHLYWSQTARYHSLVFLLSAGVPVALYVGVREKSWKWVALATLLAVLGILAHPSAAFVVAGCSVWLAGTLGLKAVRERSLSPRLLAVAAALLILFALASFFHLVPMLISRFRNPEPWGLGGPLLLMSYGNWLTAGVAVFACGGLVWMWRDDSRELAALIAFATGVPIMALAVLGYLIPVSAAYLFATAPFVLMAAGYFLDRATGLGTDRLSQNLIGGTCALALFAGALPSIASHYANGGRADLKGAAKHIEARVKPGDLVVSDQAYPVRYYLPTTPVRGFSRDPTDLDSKLQRLSQDTDGGRLWIVAEILKRAGFVDQGLGPALPWVWEHCVLETVISHPRLDYKVEDLNVYRCDSKRSLASAKE